MTEIAFKEVNSSMILGVAYDEENHELHVHFRPGRGGRTYIYKGVPQEVYREMMAHESAGKYFMGHIINVYKARRVV